MHSSCNGGVSWSPMTVITPSTRDKSRLVTLALSPLDRGVSCRFKIWQPYHSGTGKDVWSIDDLYVGLNHVTSLVFNSSAPDAGAFVGPPAFGPHCRRQQALLMEPVASSVVVLETFPIRIDSFSMLQVRLLIVFLVSVIVPSRLGTNAHNNQLHIIIFSNMSEFQNDYFWSQYTSYLFIHSTRGGKFLPNYQITFGSFSP